MSFKTLTAFIVLSTHAVFTDELTDVSVVTDPSSSPFQIFRSVEFFCLPDVVASQEKELLNYTYTWEFQRNSQFINSFFFGGQNLTHIQYYLSYRFIWFFCKVYSDKSNTDLVALGSKLVEYHGDAINSNEPPVQTFASGSKVKLNVSNSGLHGVSWYHNGTEIHNSSRINVNERQLTIHQAESSDAGIYQVRINSLFSSCSDSQSVRWLHLLENVAVYAPVTFFLHVNGFDVSQEYSYDPHDLLPTMPVVEYYYSPSASFTISEQYHIKTDTSFLDAGYNLLWVHNGTRINLNNPRYNTSLSWEAETLHLSLEILNFTDSDAGFYKGVVNCEPSVLLRHFGCNISRQRLGISQVPVALIPISVKRYEFDVTLAIYREEAAILLTCSINTSTGVSMHMDKSLLFTLTKNGKTLVTFWDTSLVFNTSNSMNPHIYGLYVCTIEKSEKNASLLLQESARFQVEVSSSQGSSCQDWLGNSTSKAELLLAFKQLLQRLCACFPTTEIEESKCSQLGNTATLAGVIVYSDDHGRVTANTIVSMLTVWSITTEHPFLSVNELQYKLQVSLTFCSSKVNLTFQSVCLQPMVMTSPQAATNRPLHPGVYTGLFFGGLLTGILIMLITWIAWWQCCCKKNSKQLETYDIKNNEAYTTVHLVGENDNPYSEVRKLMLN